MTEQSKEDYWFNVGGLAGMLMFFICFLPLIVIAGLIRDLLIWQKFAYGILPMVAYLLLCAAFMDKIILTCKKMAIKEMDRNKKEAPK